MKSYAASKYTQNVEEEFEKFKVYYQSEGTLKQDWEATWKQWVLNKNRFANHLPRQAINEKLELDNRIIEIASQHISKDNIKNEFEKFKIYHKASGLLKANWRAEWEMWCIKTKEKAKSIQKTKTSKEKSDYRWNFRKAQDTSNKIKDWLEFEKGINWLDDYYWKGESIPGIGWQKVMHPDFNKEEILLFKIDSNDGQFMLNHQSEEILEIEVLEND